MTEKFKPTYLVSNLDKDERVNELEPHIERNIEEIKEDKTGSRTLEAKYKEFLYFMARLQASPVDQKAVSDMASRIKSYDREEMNKDMQSRRDVAEERDALEVTGEAIAARFKKIIDYKDLTIPSNLALAGNLGLKDGGVPLRAKYFGTGVSSTHIKTWDQLLFALDYADPRLTELDANNQPAKLTGKPVELTAPFSGIFGLRTDTAEGLKFIMNDYTETA